MLKVNEVSKLTGVSVRTLHHYDAIGLLKPTQVTEAGYRLYDDTALRRLQTILLFRELQFSLREIKDILDSEDFDPNEALTQQIKLLELQYKRMGELISHARKIREKGVVNMELKVFDKSEIEQYKEEAKQRWGDTKAYREYEQKASKRGDDKNEELANTMMTILSQIGELQKLSPDDETVQKKIASLQSFISENYYECTDDILGGLGQMYAADERFKKNIDKAGGDGTAEFVSRAIEVYCSRRKP